MPRRIAVIDRDVCMPKKCSHECQRFCPPQLTGQKVVEFEEGEDGGVGEGGGAAAHPVINEALCIGCGICVKKCPFSAITIVNLAQEGAEAPVHQYGANSFRLYRLPIMKRGRVVGLIGKNGVGKTTALNILSGQIRPNLGRYDDPPGWRDVLRSFQGTELRDYMERVSRGAVKVSVKPQMVEQLRSLWRRSSRELLESFAEAGRIRALVDELGLGSSLDKTPEELSGGELQRLAVAAAASRDADAYFFDEPSSYNDVYQRLAVARILRELADAGRSILLVDHDLTFLDYVADYVHVIYGQPGVYGIISNPMASSAGINALLDGYLPGDNVRIRQSPVTFDVYGIREGGPQAPPVVAYTRLEKGYPGFSLEVEAGELAIGHVLGVVGANALGKTTFLRMLAGMEKPDSGQVYMTTRVSYKPQYLSSSYEGTVEQLLYEALKDSWRDEPAFSELVRPLGIDSLLGKVVTKLSGGELQRLAIAICLLREAEVYALDEPSAFIDVEERIIVAKAIQRYAKNLGRGVVVIDHDVSLIDIVSDGLVVFTGEPGRSGHATRPLDKRTGMNSFLRELGITYRRDPSTGRPRVNKPLSRLDRHQKEIGEYYYLAPTDGDEG